MSYLQKRKQLSISLWLAFLLITVPLILNVKVLNAYLFGESVYGQVADLNVLRYQQRDVGSSPKTIEKHEILVSYTVDDKALYVVANSHMYSALDILKTGDDVLVAYDPQSASQGYVITYGLFSPMVSLSFPFGLLMLLIVLPQWLYCANKAKRLLASDIA